MSDKPFAAARTYLNSKPATKWAAILSSVFSSLCVVALLPLGYLFADLLDTHGRVPGYTSLPAARQVAFREEWAGGAGQRPEVIDKLARLKVPPLSDQPGNADWEIRHTVVVHDDLTRLVGKAAAEAHFPYEEIVANPGAAPVVTEELGLLATVAGNRRRWTGQLLGAVAAWNPWAWRPSGLDSANGAYLVGLLVLALLLAGLRGLLLNVNAYATTVTTLDAATRLRRAIYTHSQRISAVGVRGDEQAHVGRLVTGHVERVQDGLAAALAGAIRGPILFGSLTLLMLLSHFWLSVALLCAAAVVWMIAGQAAAWFRRDARVSVRRSEARLGMMKESLSNTTLVKAYLMERFSQTRFERHLADLAKSNWRRQRGDTFSKPTLLSIVTVTAILILYVAGRVTLAGEMSVAGLALKLATVAVLVLAVGRWTAALVRIRAGGEAAADIFDFLDRRGDIAQTVDAEFLQPMAKRLDLVDVSLREHGTGRMILDKVSLSVPAGTKVAILSADPDESLALAYLLTRFQDPTGGEVRIDGKNTRWVTFESVRTQIAVVLEHSLTFSDTVANNIGCGESGFTLPQIIEAAKVAHAHQFVQRLPYGYETPIGGAGQTLKPGENFRIALARAILRDPSILIIEEPAVTLDGDSLVLIDDSLARIQAGRTILFLARRASTAKTADQVFVLQNGRLVASGKHQDLVNGSELYRLLHFKQTLAAGTV